MPATAAQAVAMVRAGLGWLAQADATALTGGEQADVLRGLEQAQSQHTAARSKVLTAFAAGGAHQADGQPTAGSWLRSQTRVTHGAAAGAIGWARRLAAHPGVAAALAGGSISASWARELCTWTDLLPAAVRGDADALLLAAAAAGADLADLAKLAQEIRQRTAGPDTDDTKGFGERYLSLATTLDGAGVLRGDLTPQCAAAVAAVLESLGKKHGPEDTRTKGQRDHDALEEAMRRLIAAGGLPERGGQPVHIQLQMTLDQLRGLPGADTTEAAWAGTVAGPGADCDATIIPVVTGHVDPAAVDQLARLLHQQPASTSQPGDSQPGDHSSEPGDSQPGGHSSEPGSGSDSHPGGHSSEPGGGSDSQPNGHSGSEPGSSSAAMARGQRAGHAVRQMIIRRAADLLSGPGGLAAVLRSGISDRLAASISLPLDVGAATEIIPAHLRRAVITRDRHCRFPGCDQPPAGCQPHHIVPRSEGGPTSLSNMLLLCSFHHLIAVHRWGWQIVLWPDGTVSATSPDRSQTLHSHGPPQQAA